MPDLLINYTL